MHCAPGVFRQARRCNQRGAALEQGDRRPIVLDRQPVAVRSDQPRPGLMDGLGKSAHRVVAAWNPLALVGGGNAASPFDNLSVGPAGLLAVALPLASYR